MSVNTSLLIIKKAVLAAYFGLHASHRLVTLRNINIEKYHLAMLYYKQLMNTLLRAHKICPQSTFLVHPREALETVTAKVTIRKVVTLVTMVTTKHR
jgi:hypothetical protein